MKVNKESSAYTFGFSIVLVVVVGAVLSSLSLGLKPMQKKNDKVKKEMDILSAIGIESTRENATDLYKTHIPNSYVIAANGELLEGEEAFKIDVRKQIRDKKIEPEERLYPIFEAQKDGNEMFVLPVVGKGLWGPIWGYIAIGEDQKTIVGTSFDHKTETPGLGAEINRDDFEERYIGGKIEEDGKFVEISVVKDGSGSSSQQKVDGITGGTITSKGVEEMMNRTMKVYQTYFSKK